MCIGKAASLAIEDFSSRFMIFEGSSSDMIGSLLKGIEGFLAKVGESTSSPMDPSGGEAFSYLVAVFQRPTAVLPAKTSKDFSCP